MPSLLVNENFPIPALKLLRARGVQAEAVQELMPGALDPAVLAYARAHGHWLVTFDRDYGELVFARGEPPPVAIVYLRQQPYPPTRPADMLLSLLSRTDEVEGHFVTVTEQAIRLRRLPTAPPR